MTRATTGADLVQAAYDTAIRKVAAAFGSAMYGDNRPWGTFDGREQDALNRGARAALAALAQPSTPAQPVPPDLVPGLRRAVEIVATARNEMGDQPGAWAEGMRDMSVRLGMRLSADIFACEIAADVSDDEGAVAYLDGAAIAADQIATAIRDGHPPTPRPGASVETVKMDFRKEENSPEKFRNDGVEGLRALSEALRNLEKANDALAATRAKSVYNLMLKTGQQEQIEALDVARRNARAALSQSNPARTPEGAP